MKSVICFNCSTEFKYEGTLSRNASCAKCDSDLKVCLNCKFHSKSANNECTESQAEPVAVKDRANFCGYFEPGEGKGGKMADNAREEAKKRLEALFKK